MRVLLDGSGDHDVIPYTAEPVGGGEAEVLGFYGAPRVPGIGYSAIYSGQRFSLVVTDPESDDRQVACGDLLRPEADKFRVTGLALIQLAPAGSSDVHGVALLQRARLERELDVTPTRVQILLSDAAPASATGLADAYDGYIQGGTCDSPNDRVHVNLGERGNAGLAAPYLAQPSGGGEPVTLAYYGASGAAGFGLAAAYGGQAFSVVIVDRSGGDPAACGDILKPVVDGFTTTGLALVQLKPTGSAGVEGYALIQRVVMQRELDITPTRVRVVLFVPPVR